MFCLHIKITFGGTHKLRDSRIDCKREIKLTCIVVSLMTTPPAETFITNFSLRFLLFVNIYAARGFDPEFITSKLSSSLSTCFKQRKNEEKKI